MIIVFDEGGVEADNRRWQSNKNRAITNFLETWRWLNLGLIFTTTSLGNLDKKVRSLLNVIVETLYIDYKNAVVISKYKECQNNPVIGKVYIKYPRDEKGVKIDRVYTRMPSTRVWQEYLKKKYAYSTNLNKELAKKLRNEKKKSRNGYLNKHTEAKRVKNIILRDPHKFKNTKGRFDILRIWKDANTTNSIARYVKSELDREFE